MEGESRDRVDLGLVLVAGEEQLGDEEAGLTVCGCDADVARCHGGVEVSE